MKKDYYVGKIVYRIVTWEDYPNQDQEFMIIKSNYDEGDWEEVAGYDTIEEVETHIEKLIKEESQC